MITDGLASGEPLIGGVIIAESGDLPGRADAFRIAICPDAYEQAGVKGGGARPAFHRFYVLTIAGKIDTSVEIPDRTSFMIGRDEVLHVLREADSA